MKNVKEYINDMSFNFLLMIMFPIWLLTGLWIGIEVAKYIN